MRKMLTVLFCIFCFISCDSDDKDNRGEVLCTEEFRSVVITVVDGAEFPLALDSIKTYINGKDIQVIDNFQSMEYIEMRIKGVYWVCSDMDKDSFYGKTQKVTVVGYLNDKAVFEKETEIGADECHVYMPNNQSMSLHVKIEDTFGCTAVFMAVPLRVEYKDGSPVALDSYKVMLDGNDITSMIVDFDSPEYALAQKLGAYAIVDDRVRENLEGKLQLATFIGYKDGKEVINEYFWVAADRCHVLYPDFLRKPLLVILEK